MPRSASLALLAHMSSSASTIGYLQKAGPLSNGNYICITSVGYDIDYNDGTGLRRYYARTGLQLANIAGANDLTADNSESSSLVELPAYPGQGVTFAMIDNGDLENLEFAIYAVNYRDLSMGHTILSAGLLGRPGYQAGGVITLENRTWADLLRQNSVCSLTSQTCRTKHFGSQPGDEREYCGYDLTGEWHYDIPVTAIGAEIVRDFTASSLAQPTDWFTPSLAKWKTGTNAGRSIEVAKFTSGGILQLQFALRHPIQVGDTFDLRRDCTRLLEGNNGCKFYNNILNNRSEAYTPVADYVALVYPGAAAGGF